MTARGIRNCNPGNLRKGSAWQGLAQEQTDTDFCVFVEMKWGIRALFKTLLTYRRNYGLKTVHSIVNRFAPSVENDTKAYVEHVSSVLGVMPHQTIDLNDGRVMMELGKAIALHECGADAGQIRERDWRAGAELAGLCL